MALEQRLSVRMSQRLIMTPSLQQAIKLLQMSKLELVDEIQQELTENPVLEEALEEGPAAERTERRARASASRRAPPLRTSSEPEVADPFEDIDYESYFQDVEGTYLPRRPSRRGGAPLVREHARREAGPRRPSDLAARYERIDSERDEGDRPRDHRQPERGRLPPRQRRGAPARWAASPPRRSGHDSELVQGIRPGGRRGPRSRSNA